MSFAALLISVVISLGSIPDTIIRAVGNFFRVAFTRFLALVFTDSTDSRVTLLVHA